MFLLASGDVHIAHNGHQSDLAIKGAKNDRYCIKKNAVARKNLDFGSIYRAGIWDTSKNNL